MEEEDKENKRFFSRLKNLHFTLYEIEEELSRLESNKRITLSTGEYDYLQSLKDRQKDTKLKIQNLIEQYYEQPI